MSLIRSLPSRPAVSSTRSGLAAVCLVLLLASSATAAEPKRVVFHDGRVVVGQVEGPKNGVYTLTTPDGRRQRLPYYRVKRVEPVPAAEAQAPAKPGTGVRGEAVRDLQRRMATDPKLAGRVSKLQGSPAMQSLLQDPEILQAIASGDLGRLQNDPKIQRVMRDPALRQILEQMQAAPKAEPAAKKR